MVPVRSRAALASGVMFPQLLPGAAIAFLPRDLSAYYGLVGRLFPSISARNDQHIGGIVSWIPPAMMSIVAVLLVLNALRLHEERTVETEDDASSSVAALAGRSGDG